MTIHPRKQLYCVGSKWKKSRVRFYERSHQSFLFSVISVFTLTLDKMFSIFLENCLGAPYVCYQEKIDVVLCHFKENPRKFLSCPSWFSIVPLCISWHWRNFLVEAKIILCWLYSDKSRKRDLWSLDCWKPTTIYHMNPYCNYPRASYRHLCLVFKKLAPNFEIENMLVL